MKFQKLHEKPKITLFYIFTALVQNEKKAAVSLDLRRLIDNLKQEGLVTIRYNLQVNNIPGYVHCFLTLQ